MHDVTGTGSCVVKKNNAHAIIWFNIYSSTAISAKTSMTITNVLPEGHNYVGSVNFTFMLPVLDTNYKPTGDYFNAQFVNNTRSILLISTNAHSSFRTQGTAMIPSWNIS